MTTKRTKARTQATRRAPVPLEVTHEVALGDGLFIGRMENGDLRLRYAGVKRGEVVWQIDGRTWQAALTSLGVP